MSIGNDMVQYLPHELYRYLNRPAPLGGGAKYLYGYARIKCAHGPVYSYGCRSEKEHLQRMLSWGMCTADRTIGGTGRKQKSRSCRTHHQHLAILGYLIGAYPKRDTISTRVLVAVAAACGLRDLFQESLMKYHKRPPNDRHHALQFAADYRFIRLAERLSGRRFCVTNGRPGSLGGTDLSGYFTSEGEHGYWYVVAVAFFPEVEYSEAPRWLAEQKGRIYTVNPPRFETE